MIAQIRDLVANQSFSTCAEQYKQWLPSHLNFCRLDCNEIREKYWYRTKYNSRKQSQTQSAALKQNSGKISQAVTRWTILGQTTKVT